MDTEGHDVADEQAAQRDRERSRRLRAALVLLVVVVLVVWWLLLQIVTVPDVVGQRMDDAQANIERAGLAGSDVVPLPPGSPRSGQVVAQCPEGGTRVFRWRMVRLFVMADEWLTPRDEVEVPDDTDVTLTWDVEREDRPEAPFARPPGPPRVPQVFDMTEGEATALLRRRGYRWAVEFGSSSTDVKAGRVFYQDPPPDTVAPLGTVVVIRLSTGPPPIAQPRIN